MAISGAITGDRNANSATKGRDVTRLRRERHIARRRAIERNGTYNRRTLTTSINKIYGVRGASGFPRIGLPRASASSQRARKRHRVCSWGGAGLFGEKQDSDGNYSSSGVCCERLAKIPAKKRINVTGGGEREGEGEGGRGACLFSCRITVAEIISRCSLGSAGRALEIAAPLAIRAESPR